MKLPLSRCVIQNNRAMTSNRQDTSNIMNKIENAVKKRDVELLHKLLESKPNLNTERGGRLLWDALGNVEIATMLVKAGAKVNMSGTAEYKRDSSKYRFLHWLAARDDDRDYLRLAQLMMDRGADVKERDESGDTALHVAVKEGATAFIKEFLKRGADVEATNEHNVNPIHIAINGILDGTIEAKKMLPLLIKSGDASAETIRRRGIMAFRHSLYEFRNFTEPMQVLLDLGIPIDALDDGMECEEQAKFYFPGHWCMPLHYANYFGHMSTVEFFLNHGTDINKQAKCGVSALTMALYKDISLSVQTLIKRGADIHSCNEDDGQYPIHVACRLQQAHNVKFLLNLGADISVKEKDGKTPLALGAEQFDERYDKEFDESFMIMVKYFALLMSKNGKVDKNDLLVIVKYDKIKKYYKNCLDEIEKMKRTMIHKDTSVFDLFAKSIEDISLLDKHANFLGNCNMIKKVSFPLYFAMLENKIKLAKKN